MQSLNRLFGAPDVDDSDERAADDAAEHRQAGAYAAPPLPHCMQARL